MNIFKKNKIVIPEMGLKEIFESVEWPGVYTVTLYMANEDELEFSNVSQDMLDLMEQRIANGNGIIRMDTDNRATGVPAAHVVYYTTVREEPTMWNEDELS